MRLVMLALPVLLGAACAHQHEPAAPVAKVVHDDRPAAPPPLLSEAECGKMYDHICDLMLATVAPADRPGVTQELAANRQQTVTECGHGEVSRDQYDCFMKASSAEALRLCVPQQGGGGDSASGRRPGPAGGLTRLATWARGPSAPQPWR
jgi:hypothetical protein